MTLAQHIVLRPADSRPSFTDIHARRLFTEKVVRVGDPFGPLAWGAGDNHGHVAMMGEQRGPAAELARRIESSLTRELRLTDGFAPAKIKPVSDQAHLYSTLPYIIGQGERHGVLCDPSHEGSSLPDMVGLRRLVPDMGERLARVAPRFDPHRLLPDLGPSPPSHDPFAWAEATAAVFGRRDLDGRSPLVRDARRAVVELAPDASVAALTQALACSARTVRRLRTEQPSPAALLVAIIGQARWRNGVRIAARQRAHLLDPKGNRLV